MWASGSGIAPRIWSWVMKPSSRPRAIRSTTAADVAPSSPAPFFPAAVHFRGAGAFDAAVFAVAFGAAVFGAAAFGAAFGAAGFAVAFETAAFVVATAFADAAAFGFAVVAAAFVVAADFAVAAAFGFAV